MDVDKIEAQAKARAILDGKIEPTRDDLFALIADLCVELEIKDDQIDRLKFVPTDEYVARTLRESREYLDRIEVLFQVEPLLIKTCNALESTAAELAVARKALDVAAVSWEKRSCNEPQRCEGCPIHDNCGSDEDMLRNIKAYWVNRAIGEIKDDAVSAKRDSMTHEEGRDYLIQAQRQQARAELAGQSTKEARDE